MLKCVIYRFEKCLLHTLYTQSPNVTLCFNSRYLRSLYTKSYRGTIEALKLVPYINASRII